MKYTLLLTLLLSIKLAYAVDDYYMEYEDEEEREHIEYPSDEKEVFFYGREDDDNYSPNKTDGEIARLEYLWEIDAYV